MIIYKITNLINNKVYIGQTTRKLSDRWSKHTYYARKNKNHPLYDSINKYGIENFKIEIIDSSAISIENLNKLEEYYIKQFNSTDRNFGYNLTYGGQNSKRSTEACIKCGNAMRGKKHTEECKKRMSEIKLGIKHGPMSQKQKDQLRLILLEKWKDDEFRKHMLRSNHMVGKYGEKHHFYGKHHTKETKNKISIASKGRKGSEKQKQTMREKKGNKNASWIEIDLNKIIELTKLNYTQKEIADNFNVNLSTIRNRIRLILGYKNFNDFKKDILNGRMEGDKGTDIII